MQPKLHITDFWIFKPIVYVFEEHFACVDSLMCFRLFQYDGNVYIYVEGVCHLSMNSSWQSLLTIW